MAASSWMLRRPNVLSSRFHRSRQINKEDYINFDIKNDPRQNINIILSALCQISDISDGKRLNYLNAFVRVTLHIEGNFENVGLEIKDVLICLRTTLGHDSTQVRAGGLRAIRHVIRNDDDIDHLNSLQIPTLVARSLDVVLKNDVERIEAMKLIRKLLLLSPANFHAALARALVSLANGGAEGKDRMLRICLATLCELGVMNTGLFIEVGGVAAIIRNILECQIPKISESLCGVLLYLLDKPTSRYQAAIDLHSLAAPYCDFSFRQEWKKKENQVDEKELQLNCSRLALLSLLRSWPGILHFCNPQNKSGLKALVDVLYLNQLEVRKAVLDLLYELLGLPQPEWTDELSVALSAVDPSEPQSSWRLNEGFVAAEGRSILPHLSKTTPSITEMHLAFLLYSFLECGLLEAIAHVIVTSDTFISVRATVLLGELLHLIQVLLPPECSNISPALPSLLENATYGKPQAIKAISGLQQLQKLLRSRPASYSLYLDFIMRNGRNMKFSSKSGRKTKHRLKSLKLKLQQFISKDGDDVIKETGVLSNKDAYTWNWNAIRMALKGESVKIDLMDASHRTFLKRLVDFYTPSNNRFSHMDLTTSKVSLAYTMTGIDLINCLLEAGDEENTRFLMGLFSDIATQITAITSGKNVHDCLFSPQHMNNTQCQSYFLFIGRLATSEVGMNLLNNLGMFRRLEHLALSTNNDCYVKLIVSSMDYSNPGPCRDLLKTVLKCPVESSRLYATQFLLVLLRAGISNFSDWGIRFLVSQLEDQAKSICISTLSTLHEACEIAECLETLVKVNPDLTHLGEKGVLLSVRILSVVSGFQVLNKTNFIADEIKKWDEYYNYRYVKLVEGETSDVLTLHQRDEDGKYVRRTSMIRSTNRKDTILPPHIYGQLAQHSEGFSSLIRHGSLESMIQSLEDSDCGTDQQILQLKASLWALGHFAGTHDGLTYLLLHNGLAMIITLAEECLVFSIRATAFYVLGLIATTHQGSDELFRLGWFSTRHNRHTSWPIIVQEAWEEDGDDSLRIHYELPTKCTDFYFFDSGIKDVEGSTDDDTSESNILSEGAVQGHQKSLTLPANQNMSSSYHKRSLSESKTFEIIRYPVGVRTKDKGSSKSETSRRVRNNSTTESTTSGVSSCDSGCGGKSTIYEHQQLLSPIPSSCSLSTLKQSGQKIRRHSESSQRVSVQSGSNSDRSSHSLSGNPSSRLRQQDLVGYATLRHIRKSPRYFEEPAYASDEVQAEISWDVPSSFVEECESLNTSFPSVSSVKRFSINETPSYEERCYMGITLPENINALFIDDVEQRHSSLENFPEVDEDTVIHAQSVSEEGSVWKHDVDSCLNCLGDPEHKPVVFCEITDSLESEGFTSYDQNLSDSVTRSQILRLSDKFLNPVLTKQIKQSLLHCKQRSPQVFQDLCLYSEVLKMMAESSYRLPFRRMLHELFLEVDYSCFYKESDKVLKKILDDSDKSEGDKESDGQTSIKKLDSLKLSYKENKFPIRNRHESKIV